MLVSYAELQGLSGEQLCIITCLRLPPCLHLQRAAWALAGTLDAVQELGSGASQRAPRRPAGACCVRPRGRGSDARRAAHPAAGFWCGTSGRGKRCTAESSAGQCTAGGTTTRAGSGGQQAGWLQLLPGTTGWPRCCLLWGDGTCSSHTCAWPGAALGSCTTLVVWATRGGGTACGDRCISCAGGRGQCLRSSRRRGGGP